MNAHCEEILDAMGQLFAVSRDEALMRMNRHWRGQTMTSEDDLLSLRRELPDHWARRIYHGPDAKWWLAGGQAPRHTDDSEG